MKAAPRPTRFRGLREFLGSPRRRGGLGSLLVLLGLALLPGCKKTRSIEELVHFDLLAHPFEAIREFRSHLPGDQTWYEESLASMGDGSSFDLLLLKVGGQPRSALSGAALQDFDLFQRRLQEGEGYRVLHQRDFRVEDLTQALQNYRVLPDRGVFPWTVAPPKESYLSFWVLPVTTDRSSYHVTVSMEPGREGFPLSYREFIDVGGVPTLAYEMTVRSLTYGSSRSFLSRGSPVLSREEITLKDAARASHPVYLPVRLPKGFDLHQVERVVQNTDAGGQPKGQPVTMQRMIFTDGIARLDLVQHGPIFNGASAAPGAGKANPLVLLLKRMGPLHIAHGSTDSSEFVIESRITGIDFRNVLQSLSRIH